MIKNKILVIVFSLMLLGAFMRTANVSAMSNSFTVSPMHQSLILTPGETIDFTVAVANPYESESDITYNATVGSFTVVPESYDYSVDLSTVTNYNQMMNWITIKNPTGTIKPNEVVTVIGSIKVPEDALGGGQYASINITSVNNDQIGKDGVGIMEEMQIASVIYATVTGDITESGEIVSAKIPSFNFSAPLNTVATTKNTGNVHQTAKYTLEIYPLFSGEEIYTNAEEPATASIMPDQTYAKVVSWDQAPSIGIFKVRQTVEFSGQSSITEKLVIICPLWLLFIIIAAAFIAIFYLVSRAKARKRQTA